jgi:hypothetical protein
MSSTGNVFPVTGENNAGIGATAWTTPENVVSDNATDATCNAAASSNYLIARNFGFSIPTGAVINGITVRVEASEHSTSTESLNARLQDDTGTLTGSSKNATISGTTKAVYTYGSVSDVWGATLTPAIVNDADFGVRLWFTTAHDVRIDYVTLAIEYTITLSPSAIATGAAFGSGTVSPGSVALSPSGIATGAAFGGGTVTTGAVTLSPSGIATGVGFGNGTITQMTTLSPSGIATGAAFGNSTILVGSVVVSTTGISSSATFGAATVTGGGGGGGGGYTIPSFF